jgi:hypothetical protein
MLIHSSVEEAVMHHCLLAGLQRAELVAIHCLQADLETQSFALFAAVERMVLGLAGG